MADEERREAMMIPFADYNGFQNFFDFVVTVPYPLSIVII